MQQYKNKFTALFWRNLPYFGYSAFGIIFIALVLLDVFSVSQVSMLTGTHIPYAIAALGINLLLGYAGLVSLGTAGFMGLGAYLTAFFMVDLNWSFAMSLVASVTFCVIVGLLTGFIACRVSGWYLAIATLAIAEMLRNIFSKFEKVTKGEQGKQGCLPYDTLFGQKPFTEKHMLILMIVALTIIMIFTLRIFKSYYGRAMLTMNGSEPAAQTMGVNLTRYRLLAFAIATAYTGIAGVFYATASDEARLVPIKWLLFLSLNLFAVVIIGGLCSISGTLIGTFIMYVLVDMWLKTAWPSLGIENWIYILSGVLIIVVSIFWPGGVVSLFIKLKFVIIKWNYKRKTKKLLAKMQAAGPMGGGNS